jgi:diguanylate cyclase (GGDEF)-like protein
LSCLYAALWIKGDWVTHVNLLPEDRTLAQQLSGAFKFFGTLVAGAFIVAALAFAASRAWLTPGLVRSRLAVRSESAANAAMLDEEIGLRAYLATRDVRTLEGYARAEVALARANKTLATTAGAVPELAAAMLGTRLAEERWHERWAKPAATTPPAAVGPSMIEGKTLFDAYRTVQAAFADTLNQHSDVLSQREQRVIAAGITLELAVFFAVLLLAVQQHRALHAAIVVPVAALLRHIRHIRDGQLETTVEGAGPRELAELADGLNEMVRALAAARESAVSRDETLREHSLQLRLILDASREFSESLNLAYVVGAVRESTAAVGGYTRVIVWLMDTDQKRLLQAEETGTSSIEMGQGVAGRAAKSGRITFEGAAGRVRFSDSNIGPVCAIAVPLIVGARIVGALEARNNEPKVATTQVVEVLETLATHAATAIESARLHEVIEERSHMDALTRLFNRRRFEEDIQAECKRSARYGSPLSFVMLDVDHFKEFNDAHGHPQADTALQQVADVISGCLRATDSAYRYGGEEFCILLRETRAQDAMLFTERVRQQIEHHFSSGVMAGITASFGVAGFSADATPTPRLLVEAADAAMYAAKHAGRNRVVLSPTTPLPPGSSSGEGDDQDSKPSAGDHSASALGYDHRVHDSGS